METVRTNYAESRIQLYQNTEKRLFGNVMLFSTIQNTIYPLWICSMSTFVMGYWPMSRSKVIKSKEWWVNEVQHFTVDSSNDLKKGTENRCKWRHYLGNKSK